MRVVIFGATGMVGQGVLRESLLDPRVTEVQTIGRKATGQGHAKLREVTPAWYRVIYMAARPLAPLMLRLPRFATSTDRLGQAMIQLALHGSPKRVLESADINDLAAAHAAEA